MTEPHTKQIIAQNWAKTKDPTKKMNKTKFEEHGLRINFDLGAVGQNMRFYAFFSIFQKTEKNSILCRKICPLEIVKLIIFFDIRH